MSTQNTLSKPNPSRKLSSIEFRRYVNSIDTLEKLIDSKEYLARYIKSKFQIKEYVDQFLEELEMMLKYQEQGHDIGYIKIWILTYASTSAKGSNFDDPERPVYEFLQSNYPDINETFQEFYNKYAHNTDKPLSKNYVSRALNALGIKAVMKKLRTNDNKPKCFMVLYKTKEELSEILRNNSLTPA
jgi:hypothetical protein